MLTALSGISNKQIASYWVNFENLGCGTAAWALARSPSFPGMRAQVTLSSSPTQAREVLPKHVVQPSPFQKLSLHFLIDFMHNLTFQELQSCCAFRDAGIAKLHGI